MSAAATTWWHHAASGPSRTWSPTRPRATREYAPSSRPGRCPRCSPLSWRSSGADRPSRWSRTCTGRTTRPSTRCRYLARRVTNLPVVLVATFRGSGLAGDHPLTRLLGTLLGDHVVRLPLEPLSVGCCPCPRWLQRRRGRRGASDHRGEPVLRHRGHRRRRRCGPHHGARRRPRQDRRVATRGQGAAAEALRDPGPRGTVARRVPHHGQRGTRAGRGVGRPAGGPRRPLLSPRAGPTGGGVLPHHHGAPRRPPRGPRRTPRGSRGVPGTTGPPRRLRRAGPGAGGDRSGGGRRGGAPGGPSPVRGDPPSGPGEPAHALRPAGSEALVGAKLLVVRREPVRGRVLVRGDRGGPGGPCRGPAGADGCASGARQGGDVRARAGGGAHGGAAVGRRVAE